jgi:hypothetical protein
MHSHDAVFSSLLLFNPFSVQMFSSAPCSQTPSVYVNSSLDVENQVLHPLKPQVNYGWYILVFTFLGRQEDERF